MSFCNIREDIINPCVPSVGFLDKRVLRALNAWLRVARVSPPFVFTPKSYPPPGIPVYLPHIAHAISLLNSLTHSLTYLLTLSLVHSPSLSARAFFLQCNQSEIGLSLLHSFGQDQERLSSIAVLDKHGHLYTRSCAIVHIMARMDMPFSAAAAVLKAVPRPVRDAAYGFVSRRRHMFGTESLACRIPEDDEVERFLL